MTRPAEECPHCGAVFAAGRLACPECGSDAATGWQNADEIDYQAVELPDGGAATSHRPRRATFWVLLVMVAAFAAAVIAWR